MSILSQRTRELPEYLHRPYKGADPDGGQTNGGNTQYQRHVIHTWHDDSTGPNDTEHERCNPPRGPAEEDAPDAYARAADRFLELREDTSQDIHFTPRQSLVEEIGRLQTAGSGAHRYTLTRRTVFEALENALWRRGRDAQPDTVLRAITELRIYRCAPQ